MCYKIKKNIICCLLLCFCGLFTNLPSSRAQTDWLQNNNIFLEPISILGEIIKRPNSKKFEIIIFGRLKPGQYIYSTFVKGEDSPIPSQIFLIQPGAKKTKAAEESKTISKFDDIFGRNLQVHKNDFMIKQEYQLISSETILKAKGVFKYQICTSKICSLPIQSAFDIIKSGE